MIHFDIIHILIFIKLDDIYGEDTECSPMKNMFKVSLEKSAIDIGVKKVK